MRGRTVPLLLVSFVMAGCMATATEFTAADMDDDDLVSRAEFSDYMAGIDAFGAYDANGDGVLSQTEYRAAVDVVLEGPGYWRGFDRDYSDDLTEEEFVNGVFASYDRDGDGWLDEAQFQAAIAGLAGTGM